MLAPALANGLLEDWAGLFLFEVLTSLAYSLLL